MGIPVLILGESGTGKSASLRHFPQDDVAVINVAAKPLPFKSKIRCYNTDDYMQVEKHIGKIVKAGCRSIVIDDAQYLMANEFMRRSLEKGYDKFTEIAKNYWTLVNMVKGLPEDVIVYFLSHLDRDQNGNEKVKTIGKLLDEKITVEGMFTIVLKTNVTDGQYTFLTQNNGHDTTKSPIGLFPSYAIDNNLFYVDEKIRNYYELGDYLDDEQIQEMDAEAAKEGITPEDAAGKKKRGRNRDAGQENGRGTDEGKDPTPTRRRGRKGTGEEAEEKTEGSASGDKPEPDGTDAGAKNADAGTGTRTRTRRRESVAETLKDGREAVKEANEQAITNSGMAEAGDADQVPFEEVNNPPVQDLPRRRRRSTDSVEPNTGEVMEGPKAEGQAEGRRRRRRG